MRFTNKLLKLSDVAAKNLIKYGSYSPVPLNMKALLQFSKHGTKMQSFEFLRQELPVRLANIMHEIQLLPPTLLLMPSVQNVVQMYETTFSEIISFNEDEEDHASHSSVFTSSNENDNDSFTDCLAKIRERHDHVVESMAKGIMEMKLAHGIDPVSDTKLQYFLDRFFMSRISIRMLINQHVIVFGPSEMNLARRNVGMISSECNLSEIVRDAYLNARFLCEHYYACCPALEMTIVDSNEINVEVEARKRFSVDEKCEFPAFNMIYVPSHLYHILFELLKNSLRAVVEFHSEHSDASSPPLSSDLPPIHIVICRGSEDNSIKISDQGGGIARSKYPEIFHYTYTTGNAVLDGGIASGDSEGGEGMSGGAGDGRGFQDGISSAASPMAGYGFGLPISRLYARYFQGDIKLVSQNGYGTDTLVILKRFSKDADELLPIFNKVSENAYRAAAPPGKQPAGDWSLRPGPRQ